MKRLVPSLRYLSLGSWWVLRAVRDHGGLLAVLGISLGERLSLLSWWKAFPGGDTYNFILIAQEILQGSYPIAEKRLPVYPLLLIFARPFADWETAAVAVAVLASLASVALLYAIGRTLGLSKTALVVGLLPFQAVAPFLFQSIRGYADTTFVALLLGTILALLHSTRASEANDPERPRARRGEVEGPRASSLALAHDKPSVPARRLAALSGLLAGLASLTRPEGVALIPAAMLLTLGSARRRLAVPLAGAAIACWLPFLLVSATAGRPLLPAEYLKDAEVTSFGVTTARDYAANVWALWQSVGADRLWAVPQQLLRDLASTRVPARDPRPARGGSLPPDNLPQRLAAFFTNPKAFPSLLVLAGLIFLMLYRRKKFLSVLLPFLAISLVIAWWGVRQRFLVPLTPLPFLVLAAGADVLLNGARRLAGHSLSLRAIPAVVGLALLTLSLGPWRAHNAAEQREVIDKNWGRGYAYYQAIQAARELPGTIAFEHRSSITLALFGEPDRGRAVFGDTHLDATEPAEQWAGLERWEVRYLVVREAGRTAFPVLSDPTFRDRFTLLRSFEHPERRGGPNRATIYAITK